MIRAGKILRPQAMLPFTNGFMPGSAMVPVRKSLIVYTNNKSFTLAFNNMSIFSYHSYSTSTPQHLSQKDRLPDHAKAIKNYKIFHYSTIIVAASLLPTLFCPGTSLALATDLTLGVALPAHLYLGMEAVINDYIYKPALRSTSKILVGGMALLVSAGLITLALKGGIGSVVCALWK
ncbi:hypothetical protein ACTA71_005822 [Dictyostelium dimigraforme]